MGEGVGSEGTFVVQRYVLTFDKVALGLFMTGITIIIYYQYTNVLYTVPVKNRWRYCKCTVSASHSVKLKHKKDIL